MMEALEWDTHLMVRWRAAEALERAAGRGPEVAPAIVPVLIAAMRNDPYPGVRARAAEALGLVGPATPDVLPALLGAFRVDSDRGVRWQAAEALGGVALHYRDAGAIEDIAPLQEAMLALAADPHPDIQRHADTLRQVIRQLEVRLRSSTLD